jgi:hypothetical protein
MTRWLVPVLIAACVIPSTSFQEAACPFRDGPSGGTPSLRPVVMYGGRRRIRVEIDAASAGPALPFREQVGEARSGSHPVRVQGGCAQEDALLAYEFKTTFGGEDQVLRALGALVPTITSCVLVTGSMAA